MQKLCLYKLRAGIELRVTGPKRERREKRQGRSWRRVTGLRLLGLAVWVG